MLALPDTAFLVIGLLTGGSGLIFLWTDRRNLASRALSFCLLAIGIDLLLPRSLGDAEPPWLVATSMLLELIAIYFGIEWGRRIGQTARKASRIASNGLFRTSQVLVVIYTGLNLGYLAIFPEHATTDAEGFFRTRGVEIAVFVPIIGTSMLLSAIAITTLMVAGIDRAEIPRLRALFFAAPFLLAGLVLNAEWVPPVMALGLLIFLSGSVRYLIIQSRRGQFMRQFLSPEVAKVVQAEGIEKALQRERRIMSVVTCDLRGFTAYARERDSSEVIDILEQYYDMVGDVAAVHGGTIKDHAGDGVLILVGAPVAMKDHARRAALLALELADRGQKMLEEVAPELGLGVGVTTGNLTVGAIKGAGRLEYVAVGNAVNLAARLCDRAENGEVLSDQRTQEMLGSDDGIHAQERPPEPLKGFAQAIPVTALFADEAPSLAKPRRGRGRRRRGIGSRRSGRKRAAALKGNSSPTAPEASTPQDK